MTLDKLLGRHGTVRSITELEQVCVYLSPYKHPHTYQIVDIIEYIIISVSSRRHLSIQRTHHQLSML